MSEEAPRRLTGEQVRRLQDALVAAFPTHNAFEQFARLHLDTNLWEIAFVGDNLRDIAFKLIRWAESRDAIDELIQSAIRANGQNEELQRLGQELSDSNKGSPLDIPSRNMSVPIALPTEDILIQFALLIVLCFVTGYLLVRFRVGTLPVMCFVSLGLASASWYRITRLQRRVRTIGAKIGAGSVAVGAFTSSEAHAESFVSSSLIGKSSITSVATSFPGMTSLTCAAFATISGYVSAPRYEHSAAGRRQNNQVQGEGNPTGIQAGPSGAGEVDEAEWTFRPGEIASHPTRGVDQRVVGVRPSFGQQEPPSNLPTHLPLDDVHSTHEVNDCGPLMCGPSPSGRIRSCGTCPDGPCVLGICNVCPSCQSWNGSVCIPILDGTTCLSDGDNCTQDRCSAGVCSHQRIPNDCGERNCGPSPSGCFSCGMSDCNDRDACTIDYCDGTGRCHNDQLNDCGHPHQTRAHSP